MGSVQLLQLCGAPVRTVRQARAERSTVLVDVFLSTGGDVRICNVVLPKDMWVFLDTECKVTLEVCHCLQCDLVTGTRCGTMLAPGAWCLNRYGTTRFTSCAHTCSTSGYKWILLCKIESYFLFAQRCEESLQ